MGSKLSIRLYLPNDKFQVFRTSLKQSTWLKAKYSSNQEEAYVRDILGRNVFTGEESFKKCSVPFRGEKVRCMTRKMNASESKLVGNGWANKTTFDLEIHNCI